MLLGPYQFAQKPSGGLQGVVKIGPGPGGFRHSLQPGLGDGPGPGPEQGLVQNLMQVLFHDW